MIAYNQLNKFQSDGVKEMIKQFLVFTLIGVSNTVVNFVVYNAILLAFSRLELFSNTDYLIALIGGFVVSVFWSFCMNRKFVFNSEEERSIPWYKALSKMYIAYGFTGIGLNSLLSIVWVSIFGLPKEILTVINDAIGLPLNFLINKFWSFRKR